MLSAEGNENMKTRVTKYLMRDETGIRRSVLKLFLTGKSYTTQNIFEALTQEGFNINYRGVSAMVGLMNTRLGILRIDVKGDHNLYSMKIEYKNAVKQVMDNY
jgi:hypothetical protein